MTGGSITATPREAGQPLDVPARLAVMAFGAADDEDLGGLVGHGLEDFEGRVGLHHRVGGPLVAGSMVEVVTGTAAYSLPIFGISF